MKTELILVGEINTGHFGDLELARDSIRTAKSVGLDVIKFQSWSPNSLFTREYLESNRIESALYQKFSLSPSSLADLAKYCQEIGLGFSSTPYSTEEVDQLAELSNVSFIKVASMELNNHQFLKYVSEKGLPVVLSTGMGTIEEISSAVKCVLDSATNTVTVLHCTSLYPTKDEDANLRNINFLKERFPEVEVGYSDHTLGIDAGIVAASMGASLIEKHFTNDKNRIGFDNSMALSKEEMQDYVIASRRARVLAGSHERKLSPEEFDQRNKMRRSLFMKHDVEKGTKVTLEMLELKRPGNGLTPGDMEKVLGSQLSTSLRKGDQLNWDHLHSKK
jgi:N-acetylneuraminate synthase